MSTAKGISSINLINTDADGVTVTEQYLKQIHSEDVGEQENVA